MKKFYTTMFAALLAASSVTAVADVNFTMGNYTITPSSGSTVKEIETIKVRFSGLADGIDAHILPENVGNYVSITCGDDIYKPIEFYAGTGKAGGIDNLLLVFPKITKAGSYTLNIAEGVVMDYDQSETHDEGEGYSINPPITATYTIAETYMNVWTLDPESNSTLSEITTITITFPKTDSRDGIDIYSSPENNITLTCGEKVYKPIKTKFPSYSSCAITFNTIKDPGQYKLTIPAEVFREYESYENESVNPEITAYYTISVSSSISDITVGNEAKVSAVDIQGRLILVDASADAIETLAPGFYIVNGKKLFIRNK